MRRRMGGMIHGSSPELRPPADLQDAAARFTLSTGETLEDASQAGLLVLVFLRHFGCTFTRQILRGLEETHQAAIRHRARLVLVHMLPDGGESRYLSNHSGIDRVSDPSCELYHAFGLKKGGIRELLGPRVWWFGFLSVFKGCGVGHLAGDGRQMPGAFLFHKGEIIAAQRAKSASDMPDLTALFDGMPHPENP